MNTIPRNSRSSSCQWLSMVIIILEVLINLLLRAPYPARCAVTTRGWTAGSNSFDQPSQAEYPIKHRAQVNSALQVHTHCQVAVLNRVWKTGTRRYERSV